MNLSEALSRIKYYRHFALISQVSRDLRDAGQVLAEEVERLQAGGGETPKTANGVQIKEGHRYFFPCANGSLEFWAYLGPQAEQTDPYPWDKSYDTAEAAEAAREEAIS